MVCTLTMVQGDFIGREAVLNEIRHGLDQQLVMLQVDTDNVDPEGSEAVYCYDKVCSFQRFPRFENTTFSQLVAFGVLCCIFRLSVPQLPAVTVMKWERASPSHTSHRYSHTVVWS